MQPRRRSETVPPDTLIAVADQASAIVTLIGSIARDSSDRTLQVLHARSEHDHRRVVESIEQAQRSGGATSRQARRMQRGLERLVRRLDEAAAHCANRCLALADEAATAQEHRLDSRLDMRACIKLARALEG